MPNYPYISGQAGLLAAFAQLRKGFPAKVDAGYLQRFQIAKANESYVISILRYLGLIDEEGNRVEEKAHYFYGNDEAFKSGLEGNLRDAYAQLFSEMGDGALDADKADLAHWFRASDKTSDLVGTRQATTFLTLAALAGHGELPSARTSTAKKTSAAPQTAAKKTATKKAVSAKDEPIPNPAPDADSGRKAQAEANPDVGLTVRIEVNLPPGGDADTYDAIFASIKKHLMS